MGRKRLCRVGKGHARTVDVDAGIGRSSGVFGGLGGVEATLH